MLLIRHCQSSHLLSLLFSYLHTTINLLILQSGSQCISESRPVSVIDLSGRLPDHIFTMFIADYDTERATLKANIAEMEKVQDTKADIDRFAALIRKYTSFEKLDRFMLHELIDRIAIYETPGMGRCRKSKEKRIRSHLEHISPQTTGNFFCIFIHPLPCVFARFFQLI